MIRFGVCASLDQAPRIAEAGYDYIELPVIGALIPDEDETAWAESRAQIQRMPLPVETFNLFTRHPIVGPETDLDLLRRYTEIALRRASEVGAGVVVFGSGGARRIPDDFPRARAETQLRDFLLCCADAADQHSVVVAIEPLNRQESNQINSVADGARLARDLGRPGVQNLADTYHMEKENEPLTAIVESADVLAHVHTADTDRAAPGFGHYDHAALFQALHTAGYAGRVSIECRWTDFDAQLLPSLQHLRQALRAAAASASAAS